MTNTTVTQERDVTTSPSVTHNSTQPLTNAERQRRYREKRKAQRQQAAVAPTPELKTYSEEPKRIGKDGKPKRQVAPTPRIHPPKRTRENPARYGDDVIDEILRLISHGATLRQACSSNPNFPSPPAFLDWVHENRAGLAERYARARDRQLEAWADEIVATADAAVTDPASANGRRLAVDVRKWLLARLKPEKYGDRVQADLTSNGQRIISLSDLELARRAVHWIGSLRAQDVVDAEVLPAPETAEPVKAGGERS